MEHFSDYLEDKGFRGQAQLGQKGIFFYGKWTEDEKRYLLNNRLKFGNYIGINDKSDIIHSDTPDFKEYSINPSVVTDPRLIEALEKRSNAKQEDSQEG